MEEKSKLQKKKNQLRKKLAEIGIIQNDKKNNFDKYTYFSECGYKALFTKLFSECGLELKSSVENYEIIESHSTKQPNGRIVKIEFELFDIDTGFSEKSCFYGESFDKGDKALYKAYTGALKYYFANNFLVATGDEPENESPEAKVQKKPQANSPQTQKQSEWLKTLNDEQINVAKQLYKVDNLSKLTYGQVNQLYKNIQESKGDKNA